VASPKLFVISTSVRARDLYAGLGDQEEVFHWLNIAYQERDWHMESIKTDFLLDSVHSDPRFAELVRKVGLPQ